MARPREFETKEALGKALEVFWTKGYKATSVQDLINAMGLSKSSFYLTFGSKHQVFLDAIEFYKNKMTAQIVSVAQLNSPARKLIESLFKRALSRIAEDDGKRGCFLNNCAVEVAIYDEEAARIIDSGFSMMEEAFLLLVQRAQNEGDIHNSKDARALARYLNNCLNGLLVTAKANPDHTSLADIVGVSLSVLD